CQELKVVKEKEETLKKLFEFEEHVYELLVDYAVSPDIFLPQSSYIRWWNEYKEIKGSSYTSALANVMTYDVEDMGLDDDGKFQDTPAGKDKRSIMKPTWMNGLQDLLDAKNQRT
ncbi:senescence-associated carboxylesterase 101-like, partial [Trifolium medium]|nr:senescence-associated carboxylesterase 101-like [Trifolium medium]